MQMIYETSIASLEYTGIKCQLESFPMITLCHSRIFRCKITFLLVSVVNFMIDCRYLSTGPKTFTLISYVAFFIRSPKNNNAKSHYEDRRLEEFQGKAPGKQIKRRSHILFPAQCSTLSKLKQSLPLFYNMGKREGKLKFLTTIKHYKLQMYFNQASLICHKLSKISFPSQNGKEISNTHSPKITLNLYHEVEVPHFLISFPCTLK